MVKLALWLATPSVITFLASSSSVRVLNTLMILALCVVMLLFGIGPRLPGKNGS